MHCLLIKFSVLGVEHQREAFVSEILEWLFFFVPYFQLRGHTTVDMLRGLKVGFHYVPLQQSLVSGGRWTLSGVSWFQDSTLGLNRVWKLGPAVLTSLIELWSGCLDPAWCWLKPGCDWWFGPFVLNYGVCVTYIQREKEWRVVKTHSFHSDALSLSSCTSSLWISPSPLLHLWRLMGARPCADILPLSFFSIAFIFSALFLHLSISNTLFLSSTGQSAFVTLRHMCACWGFFVYRMYDTMHICKWAAAWDS